MSSDPRKGKGRKKIDIKKIENKGYMQVAFSRRRSGVFKKASELTTLCGAESAVIFFSPGGKPYSFGHPDVNSTIKRYLSNGMFPNDKPELMAIDFNQAAKMYELNHEYTKLTEQLEATKKRGEELRQLVSVHAKDLDIENLDLKQLEQLKGRLQGLQIQMGQRFDELFSTLPPVLDHQLMINGHDMICDDPRHFAPQANDLDNAPNASHSPPQYVNFNDLDNAPNAGLPLYYNFNDDNAPNASHLPPQYDNFNDLDNAPNASHPPLQYDNFNDLDNAPNAGPPLYYNFNDLDNAPNASHPPPQYDNFNDLDNAPNGSHPPLQYDNFNDLDNAPNAGPPLYYNFNDDDAPNAAPPQFYNFNYRDGTF